MPFDYKTASAIARYEAISTETLRDFSYAARQTWDELQLSKIENISLQREIKNLQGEIDVLKSSLLEIEAAPQPVVPDEFVMVSSDLIRDAIRDLKEVQMRLIQCGIYANPQLTVRICLDRTLEVLLSAGKGTDRG